MDSTSFSDSKNIIWKIDINMGTAKRVTAATGVVLASLFTNDKDFKAAADPLRALLEDDISFSNVLWAIVKPDPEKSKTTQDEFDSAMNGETKWLRVETPAGYEGWVNARYVIISE